MIRRDSKGNEKIFLDSDRARRIEVIPIRKKKKAKKRTIIITNRGGTQMI